MTMSHDDRLEILERHCTMLREHFDSVEIVACHGGGGGGGGLTTRFEHGDGSWFERYGLMRSWVIRHEEGERCGARTDDGDAT